MFLKITLASIQNQNKDPYEDKLTYGIVFRWFNHIEWYTRFDFYLNMAWLRLLVKNSKNIE